MRKQPLAKATPYLSHFGSKMSAFKKITQKTTQERFYAQ
jgi:hypothetical protein